MKTKILIIFIVLIAGWVYVSTPLKISDRTRNGVLIRNEIWSGEINVIGDIFVAPWATLTIRPGTTVIVSANRDVYNLWGWQSCDGIKNYDMLIGIKKEDNYNCGVHLNEPYRDEKHHITIIILGTLKAVGTEENRIVFKSDSPEPTIYDWNTLLIMRGILSYASVENYRGIATALRGNVEISYNILKNIGECGICMTNSKAKILFNTISYAGHELIDMHKSFSIIRQNRLGPNPQKAGIIVDGGSPVITNNTIKECSAGIVFNSIPDKPVVENNTFLNNKQDILDDYLVE